MTKISVKQASLNTNRSIVLQWDETKSEAIVTITFLTVPGNKMLISIHRYTPSFSASCSSSGPGKRPITAKKRT